MSTSDESLRREAPAPEGVSTPPAAAESNASVEARLREALERIASDEFSLDIYQSDPDIGDDARLFLGIVRNLAEDTLAGDEAKKSEGGHESRVAAVSCEIPTQRSGESRDPLGDGSVNTSPHREDAAGVAPGPSDPTAERREIMARVLMEKWPGDYAWGDETREPNELAFETADAILAVLDGGTGA